ncbi:MAG: DNA recombination protein RmuC [Alcanivoracaceae bacterium]|nr:DNA recombination protein RmuC [Alcanivoracaceae bacterium]
MTTNVWVLSLLAAALGVVLGAVIIWFVQRGQGKDDGLLVSTLEQEKQERARLQQQLERSEAELAQQRSTTSQLQADKARLEEREKNQQEKVQWLEQSREQLKQDFEQLSTKIFETRTKQLQEQNRTGIEDMLKPFREQMTDFRRRVDQIHSDDTRQQADLLAQIRNLQSLNNQMVEDARNLTNALKGQNKAAGNWGELILERILEASGLTKGREYDTQVSINDDEGQRKQPDVIVRLPDDKDVVVDSKVSLVAWERYCTAEDEGERRQALDQHLSSLRAHVRGLSEKKYESLDGLRSLDFVLLFVPIEAAFLTALEADGQLYSDAYSRNIVLVSPTTLLVTLRTINNIWRNEYQNRNALEIADRAGKICDQIAMVSESLADVGSRIGQAHKAWEKTSERLSSGRGNLLRQAHQLQDMGAKARKNLPPPQDNEADESEETED